MQRPARPKKLQLNRETVKALDDQDLGKVAGGSVVVNPMSKYIIRCNFGSGTGSN